MPNTYRIERVDEHYEVLINGRFYCSADTVMEAAKEIEAYKEAEE